MRKPINFFIVNMAMSDLLPPIMRMPRKIQTLYIDSWLIGGPLGQVLCKLVLFLADISTAVYSEPGSDSTGSIWSCGISSPFPTHQFKAMPVLHSRHLDRRDCFLLTIPRRFQTC